MCCGQQKYDKTLYHCYGYTFDPKTKLIINIFQLNHVTWSGRCIRRKIILSFRKIFRIDIRKYPILVVDRTPAMESPFWGNLVTTPLSYPEKNFKFMKTLKFKNLDPKFHFFSNLNCPKCPNVFMTNHSSQLKNILERSVELINKVVYRRWSKNSTKIQNFDKFLL